MIITFQILLLIICFLSALIFLVGAEKDFDLKKAGAVCLFTLAAFIASLVCL